MQNRRMNLRLFETDANIIDRTGAEALIPIQESNEIIQGTIAQSAVLSRGRKLANMTSKQYKMPVLDMIMARRRQQSRLGTRSLLQLRKLLLLFRFRKLYWMTQNTTFGQK